MSSRGRSGGTLETWKSVHTGRILEEALMARLSRGMRTGWPREFWSRGRRLKK
jgi:hypothetical protein